MAEARDRDTIFVRKIPFEFPEDLQPHWNPEQVEWSYMVNGTSLAMPFLEPYLIRTMRKALPAIDSEVLRNEVKLYISQEGQHYQQHRKFNDLLIAKGYRELRAVEQAMAADYRAFEKTRSLKFNLAYACGFESMALGIGHWLVDDREKLFAGADTRVASLILWHFIEEIEHKNVAFDAYQSVYGDYFYRVYATVFATLHVMKFSRHAYQAMLKKDGLWNNVSSRWRLLKMIFRFFGNMLPPMLSACMPWHHPSKVQDPQWYRSWIEKYRKDPCSAIVDTTRL